METRRAGADVATGAQAADITCSDGRARLAGSERRRSAGRFNVAAVGCNGADVGLVGTDGRMEAQYAE